LIQKSENTSKKETSTKAYLSLASDDYLPGIVVLLKCLKKFSNKPVYVMSIGLSEASRATISEYGGFVLDVEPIESKLARPQTFRANPNFHQNCFYKLNMWRMDFEQIVYLDADMLVRESIEELFNIEEEFAACAPTVITINKETRAVTSAFIGESCFNAGMLVLKPSKTVFEDMMVQKDSMTLESDPSDQGFLNVYYENRWKRLSSKYNATPRMFRHNRKEWDRLQPKIIHFALEQPWMKHGDSELDRLWWKEYDGSGGRRSPRVRPRLFLSK
jgi:glycogenin glucosyltransferase